MIKVIKLITNKILQNNSFSFWYILKNKKHKPITKTSKKKNGIRVINLVSFQLLNSYQKY